MYCIEVLNMYQCFCSWPLNLSKIEADSQRNISGAIQCSKPCIFNVLNRLRLAKLRSDWRHSEDPHQDWNNLQEQVLWNQFFWNNAGVNYFETIREQVFWNPLFWNNTETSVLVPAFWNNTGIYFFEQYRNKCFGTVIGTVY